VALPYVAAISKALGSFTLGESGSLNYAWNVNGLTRWIYWQGGPAQLGMPIHPTLVWRNPSVFQFAEPFHVTYPPWFNPFYFYEGYHHFFNIENQIAALKSNLSVLREFFLRGPRAFSVALLLAIGLILLKDRKIWWNRLILLWPIYVPSAAAVSIYLLVSIEPRYLVGFLIILLTTLFVPLFVPTQLFSKKVGYLLVLLVAMGGTAFLGEHRRDVLQLAIDHPSYTSDEQWRIGLYLAQSGVHPGDKVADVVVGNGSRCTWAYIDDLHIVAEIGNETFNPGDQEKGFQLFTGSPDVQRTVFNLFRQAGAVWVVARDVNGLPQGSGWERVPGTRSWVHRL